ncbi:hypothetical protein AVEN_108036-1 [Araneus ventricosus]|uniref:NR LBD domain-containing protein n=1 Tax=Araneus ventricosus TaxID=182803 RepID=A0A4Y2LB67_ARAVE|nr:hypothetical protein AVEN_108036-1 [Araneus ventricosus]
MFDILVFADIVSLLASVSECVQQSNLLPFEYERHIENLKTYLHIMKCELAQMANSESMDGFQKCLVTTIMLFKNTKLSAEVFSELSTFQGIPPSFPSCELQKTVFYL